MQAVVIGLGQMAVAAVAALAIIADNMGVPLGVGGVIAVTIFGATSAAAFVMALRGWRTQHS